MTKVIYADRDDWVANRRKSIGASDAPILYGLGYADQSLYSLFVEKSEGLREDKDSRLLRRGRLMEPGFMAVLQDELPEFDCQLPEPYEVYYHDRLPFMSATPDGYCFRKSDGALFLAEFKRVLFKRSEWGDGGKEPPLRVQVQVQQQLACVPYALGVWVLPMLGGWDGDPILIERNDEFISQHEKTVEKFWTRHVGPGNPPVVDGSEGTRVALQMLHPDDSGECLLLPAHYDQVADERERLNDQIKSLTDKMDRIKNEFRELLGDATYGVLPDGRCVSWKTQERKSYQVKASKSRVLRFAKKAPKGVIPTEIAKGEK